MMRQALAVSVLVTFAACARSPTGATAPVQTVVVCPAGSVLEPGQNTCVAIAGAGPVVVRDDDVLRAGDHGARLDAGAALAAAPDAGDDQPLAAPVDAGAGHLTPPPAGQLAVDVACTFPEGWVTLLPAARYPRDDQFLMQALIGFTDDPGFWNGLPEYRSIKPYAARRCTPSAVRFDVAPGDYFLLAGQANTFGAKGSYDRNGVRRKVSVRASTSVRLGPRDLTHTWLCISCPWVVFSDGGGGDLAPFVVLGWRAGRERRGTDRHLVHHVPVRDGRIRLRVMEREAEVTHLDALVLRVGGRALLPARGGGRSVLATADGATLEMSRGRQVELEYAVGDAPDGDVDVTVEATGYYDPVP